MSTRQFNRQKTKAAELKLTPEQVEEQLAKSFKRMK